MSSFPPAPPVYRWRTHLASFCAICILVGAASGAALAQGPDEPSSASPRFNGAAQDSSDHTAAEQQSIPPLVLESNKLESKIAVLRSDLAALQLKLAKADGEEAQVLEYEVAEVKLDYLDVVHDLTRNVLAQQEADIDAAALRTRLAGEVKGLAPSIVRHIETSEKKMREVRKLRITAEPTEALQIEERLAREIVWLQSLYEGYVLHLLDLEVAGFPAAKVRRDVNQRLSSLADRLAGRIKLSVDQLEHLETRALESPDDEAIKAELRSLERRTDVATEAIILVADLLDDMGLDSSVYRQLKIQATGEVTADVFKGRVALGLAEEGLESLREWVRAKGPSFLFSLVSFLLVLLVFRGLAAVTRQVTRRAMTGENARGSVLVQNMALSLAGRGVMFIGLLVALSQLGIELGPLLTGLGIAGFIVGFALQDSLANFAAGIMILGYRPFDVGDLIEAGGVFGSVSHMSLVSTTILTIDNQTLIVPNGKIWGDVIKNVTHQAVRRIDMMFHAAHDADVDGVVRVLREALDAHPKVLQDPEPTVALHEIRDDSLEFIARPWVDTTDYWEVRWDLIRDIKGRFDTAGIRTPHPQRDIHIMTPSASS